MRRDAKNKVWRRDVWIGKKNVLIHRMTYRARVKGFGPADVKRIN